VREANIEYVDTTGTFAHITACSKEVWIIIHKGRSAATVRAVEYHVRGRDLTCVQMNGV